jgi:integrase
VRVRRTYSKGELGPPKSKYGKRDVPIGEDLRDGLRAHRKISEWHRDEDLVFTSEVGTYIRADNLRSRMLKPIMQEIGAPWAGFHSLRHTCASMLFERGANVKKVQRWLGHHSPAFTLNTYVHLLSDELDAPLELGSELAPRRVATEVATDPRQTQPDDWVGTTTESAL